MRPNLRAWQWEGYPEFHRSSFNLRLHIVVVPLFQAGVLGAVAGASIGRWGCMAAALGVAAAAFIAQAIGHRREAMPPIPFAGPGDAVSRILLEQFVTFPRFVLSGRWRVALRKATRRAG